MTKLIKLADIHRSLLIENIESRFIDVTFMDSSAQVTIRGEKLGVRGRYIWRGAEGLRYLHELTPEDQNTELEKLALQLIDGEDLLRGKRSTARFRTYDLKSKEKAVSSIRNIITMIIML